MQLRNKKTGEIVEICKICPEPYEVRDFSYNSLAELNEEWEDYEEPKVHWCITMYGGITRIKDDEEPIDDLIEIGNYFNSKEDAYDALYKVKAWKRLKEKIIDHVLKYEFDELTEDIHANISFSVESYPSVGNDLDSLFGGED